MKVRFHVPEAQDVMRDHGIRLAMAPSKRTHIPRWRWYLLVLLVVFPFAWIAGNFAMDLLSLSGSGYVSYAQLEMRAPVNGRIEQVLVKEGDDVSAETLLLQLHNTDVEKAAALQNATIPTVSGRPAAKADLRPLLDAIQHEQAIVEKYRQLQADGAATLGEVQEAEGRLLAARRDLEAAGRDTGNRTVSMRVNTKGLEEMQLRAPAAGQVERIWVKPGEFVVPNSPMLTLRTNNEPVVRAWMDSRYMNRVQEGRAATVRLPDGSHREAVITRVELSTEKVPNELHSPLAENRSNLLVLLQLQQDLGNGQQVNNLPVEVKLHWLDDYPRLKEELPRLQQRAEDLLASLTP
ncbi:MAG: HlyD family efflux transporter periplasmic adaptor subunit [Pedobacter sp.]|nr:HlyD family efflux transporter periplasmic adaptor subunit [Pedobacter sp.]